MKFGPNVKMRIMMFSNYPYSQTFKKCFKYSFNEFRNIYNWILTKITNYIFWIWDLLWLVKTSHSIQKFKKEIFSKDRTPLVSRNSKFYNTRTMLKCLSLKNSPRWSLTWIDMIQIGLESRLDFLFENIFYFFKNWFFHTGQTGENGQLPLNGCLVT